MFRIKTNQNFVGFSILGIVLITYIVIVNTSVFSTFFHPKMHAESAHWKVQIVMVLTRDTDLMEYSIAFDSLKCYASIHNYQYRWVYDDQFEMCTQKDLFFRRHCVVSELLIDADYTLFLDADIGVVNPNRKIEEFINPKFDLTFYDRFYNQEIATGSYIAKNSQMAKNTLRDFADFESQLPRSFTGTDNGAIHLFLAKLLFLKFDVEIAECSALYNVSKNYDDLFAYIACIKTLFGAAEDFGSIKVFQKGTGWVRDAWLTNGKWNKNQDFMLHGLKRKHMKTYTKKDLPLSSVPVGNSGWYLPFVGDFSISKCTPRNSTWLFDMNLHSSEDEIKTQLRNYYVKIEKTRWKFLSMFAKKMKYSS